MKRTFFLNLLLFLCINFASAQIIESHRIASNALWETYGRNANNPSQMPEAVPLNVSPNIDQVVIAPNFNDLETALTNLLNNNGGIIRFNNTAPTTINFSRAIKLNPLFNNRDKERTIVIQGKDITFDGQNNTSLFVIRGSIKLVVQDAVFRNANFKGVSQANLKKIFRSGGGAIEVAQAGSFFASLRVRNCQFIDNEVSHFNGTGENQNGAAIRINNKSTVEVFGCTFNNNKAVTGGAIGGTSIERLTIIDSSFDSNLSNGYKSTTGYMDVVEGAGAIRVDRTVKPLEIYGSSFTRNSANVKVSVMEVFIAPVFGSSPGSPINEPALVIDNCQFKNNKYNNYAGVSNFERAFFAGCIVFHGRSATMKLTNSVFDNNEVGNGNVRLINNFEFSNCIFANTKFLNVVDAPQQGAVFLQNIPESGSFNNCTFYKNEPRNGAVASDIMFWQGAVTSRVSLNNSIFYRENTSNTKQVKDPLKGNGNNQYIPTKNMSSFPNVTTNNSNKTNPNIVPRNITDMCLGTNSLPANIGGLKDCSATPDPIPDPTPDPDPIPDPTPTGIAIPGTIQVENFIAKSGEVKAENTPGTNGGQNLGFIKNTNYTEYNINVASSGSYKLEALASSNGVGGNIVVSIGGTDLTTLVVPVNNNWHDYSTAIIANADLVTGVQKIRFTYTGPAGFLFNFESIKFSLNTSTPTPEPPTLGVDPIVTPTPEVTDSNTFFIVNRQTGKKLKPQSNTDGANLIQVDASTNDNFVKWEQVDTSNGYFYLKNVSTGKYFRPAGDNDGSSLEQRPTSYSGNYTQWKKVATSGGYFYLQNRQTNQYFRPTSDVTNSPMIQRPTNYSGNYTQWTFQNISAKSVNLSSEITVYPNPTTNGINVIINKNNIGATILIHDLEGRTVNKTITATVESYIDLSTVANGFYIVKIVKERKVLGVKKIIVN